MKKLLLIFAVFFLSTIIAEEISKFAVIKSGKVNARSGPGIKYPIKWTYIKKGEPVEITATFEQWREIKDYLGDKAWVHTSMITSKRLSVIITSPKINLYKDKNLNSYIIAYIMKDARCKVIKEKGVWCKLHCKNVKGWTLKEDLWGIE